MADGNNGGNGNGIGDHGRDGADPGADGETRGGADGDLPGHLHETLADLLDGHDLGALLMGQLEDLIDSWAKVIEVVTEHGVDPTPLLLTLARTLRATADQLDPTGRATT